MKKNKLKSYNKENLTNTMEEQFKLIRIEMAGFYYSLGFKRNLEIHNARVRELEKFRKGF